MVTVSPGEALSLSSAAIGALPGLGWLGLFGEGLGLGLGDGPGGFGAGLGLFGDGGNGDGIGSGIGVGVYGGVLSGFFGVTSGTFGASGLLGVLSG